MQLLRFRERLLASTIVAGAVFAAPAYAQVEPNQGATPTAPIAGGSSTSASPDNSNSTDASGNTGNTGEIVVTGSRISNPSLTSQSPLTVVNQQEFKLQGAVRVEDTLNQLPSVTVSQSSTDVNGASGIATVSLRNLGSVRTLVLVNGRRLVPGDPTSPSADLNFIPNSLIQRVDVLTGGASSVYGSDAVAGVVNFVMNKDFEGFQIDAQYSLYQHDNDITQGIKDALNGQNGTTRAYGFPSGNTVGGRQRDVSLTMGTGTADGRGHITAYATWRKSAAVSQADRDFSSCALYDGTYLGRDPGLAYCSGSSTTDVGRFRRTVNTATGDTPVYSATGASFTTNPAAPGTFRTYSAARDAFNFNPYNYFQRPDERYTLGAFAHYQVSDAFDPYIEAMFMDDHTDAQIAPSGAFYGTDFFVNCNNPLLSASQATALCGANAGTGTLQSLYIGRRNVEGGARDDDLRHTAYRIVAGAKGDIAKGISYDAYGQIGRTIYSERYSNDFSRSRLNNALNVVNSPTTGLPVCASTLPNAAGAITDANCVPYNIFTAGGVTPQAVNYLQVPGLTQGSTTEYVVSGSISVQGAEYGVKSPFADNGIGLAFGGEYRKEALSLRHDVEFLTGDLAGQGTPFGVADAAGKYDVKEGFVELEIPVVSDKPFFYDLSANASYRYSDYNIQGTTNTYKFGAEWAPIKDIRFRGTYNRAVRAPNILELFTPATVQLFSGTDPCAGGFDDATNTTVNGNTAAQCARTGVTAAQFGNIDASPASQYNQRTAGNRNLKPEVADTYTAGIVINPTFARSFVLSVDAYQIKIKKIISGVGAQYTLNQCLASGDPALCNSIVRSGDGSLFTGASYVDNPTQNLGSYKTRGIDVAASYKLQLSRFGLDNFGSLGFDLQGTYLDKYTVQSLASGPKYNCAGYYGTTCGVPLPKWRSNLRVSWNLPNDLQLSGRWRYIGRVKNDYTSDNTQLSNPGVFDPLSNHIKAVSYFDATVSARFADKFSFRIGAQNLLDRTPPISYSPYTSNNSNVYAGTYDALGRYIFAGVTVDL